MQVGQSFVKGLNDAMAPCVRALPAGASVTQCCSIVQGVSPSQLHQQNPLRRPRMQAMRMLDSCVVPQEYSIE